MSTPPGIGAVLQAADEATAAISSQKQAAHKTASEAAAAVAPPPPEPAPAAEAQPASGGPAGGSGE